MIVLHEDAGFCPDRTLDAVVDDNGNFANSNFSPEPHHVGVVFTVIVIGFASEAQTTFTDSLNTDHFRSAASGNWNSTSTWESSSDGSIWFPATLTPTSSAKTITIRNGHTVTVTAGVTIDQTTIDAGGQVTVNSGQTLTIANGAGTDLTVNGTVSDSGTLNMAGSSSLVVNGTFDVPSGGVLNGQGGNEATKPCLTIANGGAVTISSGGSLSTGGAGPMTVTVNAGGSATVSGSMTGLDTITVNGTMDVVGSVTMSSISNLQVGGSLSLSGSATLPTVRGNGGSVGSINNGGSLELSGTSQWTIGTVNTVTATVQDGGTIDLAPGAFVTGSGFLTVASGADAKIGSPDGMTNSTTIGNVRTTAADSYNTGADYTYDGSAPQNTGNALPANVNSLTIDNSAGVPR
jgi:cytoskeletal protein CcmA (bactofilin family)